MPQAPEVDLFSIVFLLGAAQGMFLVLALLTVRNRARHANIYLALFTLTFSITLVDAFLEYTRYYLHVTWLIGIIWTTNFLYGPLLLSYANALIAKKSKTLEIKYFFHYLPFIFSWLIILPVLSLSAEVKILAINDNLEDYLQTATRQEQLHILAAYFAEIFISIATISHVGLYMLVLLKKLRAHSRLLKQEFSYTEKIDLKWLRNITIATFGLWGMLLFSELFSNFFQLEEQLYYVLHVMIAVFIYMMGYLGLRQPEIFRQVESSDNGNDELNNEEVAQDQEKKCKYEKSSLNSSDAAQLVEKLTNAMKVNHTYRNSGLTLPILATDLDSSVHNVSQVINEQFGKNFYDFVNEYRVEEAKQRIAMVEKGRLNVYAIALDSGFSSKSAFYSAFKRYTGVTPSQYKQQCSVEK